ncbi:hypothetical protein ElyMa_006296200 [Elysia marginata]|uniref:PiggyBac transposable element-derived protein domain-containing protein n=1 Tax=Elysia marginata TaxID=1093978 RepID=A0AAV4HHR7_9GAST|nr:hypothetical protein ElyMa_006296200 [Elysia marginata]
MDSSQPVPNEHHDAASDALCYPLQEGHLNGHDTEPGNNGLAEDVFVPQSPEKMEDEDLIMDNGSDEAAGFVNDNVNDNQRYEDQVEGEVDRGWNNQEVLPHQENYIAEAERKTENNDGGFPNQEQDQNQPDGIASLAPATGAAEIVVTSPDGVELRHGLHAEGDPVPEVVATSPEPAEAMAARDPMPQEEEMPSVVVTPTKDQRPSGTSTPKTLKEKISAKELWHNFQMLDLCTVISCVHATMPRATLRSRQQAAGSKRRSSRWPEVDTDSSTSI